LIRNLLSGAAFATVIVMAAAPASAGNRGEAPLLKGHSAAKQLLWARSSNQRPSAELLSAAAAEQAAGRRTPQQKAPQQQAAKAAATKPVADKPAPVTAAKADAAPAPKSAVAVARKQSATAVARATTPLPIARPQQAVAEAAPEKPAEQPKPAEVAAAPDQALKEGRATTTSELPGVTTTPGAAIATTTASAKPETTPEKTASAAPRGELQQMVARHAAAAGIPFSLAHGVVMVESRYRANATGPGGYIGLMQLSYRTAQGMGFKGTRKELYEPENNIRYGVKYLAGAYRKAGGSTCGAVSKYQGGHGVSGVTRAGAAYCAKVRRFIAQMPKDQKVQLASNEE
jgi:soluble lytic murein transglycosylase-like protein